MGLKQILPLFVIAVLVGWFMPGGHPEPVPAAAPKSTAVQTAVPPPPVIATINPLKVAPQQSGVAIDRAENGHFYARGDADGAAIEFMVDTGASVIALTAADAQKLGQTYYPGELEVVGRGASGDVIGKPIMLARVRIGDLEVRDVRAIIIPNGLDVSLLGQSFLSRIPNVNIRGDRMTLG
jgi:aspartyl protease family protein